LDEDDLKNPEFDLQQLEFKPILNPKKEKMNIKLQVAAESYNSLFKSFRNNKFFIHTLRKKNIITMCV